MINPNELKHGNIIKFDDGSNDIVKVEWFYETNDGWFVEWTKISGDSSFLSGNSLLDDFEPIHLTPEILEKAGFENTYSSKQKQSYDHLINGEFGVNFHSIGSVYDEDGRTFVRYFSENIRKPVKYVHEVQNLYFALTGKELEIAL